MTIDTARRQLGVPSVLLCVGLFGWALRPIWDIDIFFHVAIGREVLAHGIPTRDVFSAATPNEPWTPFQLGYDVLTAALDALGGLDLLRVVHAAITALAGTLLCLLLFTITQRKAATFALFVVFLVLYDDRIRVRPHELNLLFEVALVLPIARGALAVGQRRWLLWLPLCAVAWSFLHAMGALWLCAVLFAWVVAGPSEQRAWSLRALLGSLLGVLLAPGSAAGILHVLRIQDQWKEFVPELAPSWAFFSMHDAYGYFVGSAPWLATLLVLFATASFVRNPTRDSKLRAALVCAAGFAFASLWLARLVYYAVFAVALIWPILREQLSAMARRSSVVGKLASARVGVAIGALSLLLIVMHVAPRFAVPRISPWTTTLYPGAFPEHEADLLASASITAAAYNESKWGGYLLYRLFPRVRVLTDGRITYVADVAELLRYARTSDQALVAEVAYRRFGIDLLIWHRGRLPASADWKLLVDGPIAQVFVRNDARAAQRLTAIAAARTTATR